MTTVPIILPLAASVAWGCADFIAGDVGRRRAPFTVLFVSQGVGMLLLAIVVSVNKHPVPRGTFWIAAAAGGVVATAGFVALYRALALGPMSIVSPISATAIMVPVIAGLFTGDRPTALQDTGLVLAAVGVVIAAWQPHLTFVDRVLGRGPALALIAAAGLGSSLVALARASNTDPLWGALALRAFVVGILTLVAIASRRSLRLPLRSIGPLLLIGVLDTGATLAFAVATTIALLSTVGVLGQLYPIVVLLLARFVLKERIRGRQQIGVGLALLGVICVAAH
jgi:drug/metabolite transporter (DMT)-like permease